MTLPVVNYIRVSSFAESGRQTAYVQPIYFVSTWSPLISFYRDFEFQPLHPNEIEYNNIRKRVKKTGF
ncbi:hypothetical protein Trydic_g10761 [Trypoxylus dichotomus]